ncbi:hypothetical protein [Alicyclobacillus ferrooxydans]|uniref:hypothetical protein n=1 Tax=Alicyclobacillus ferrooxydans TaxID=471514 RepID=UPI000AD6A80A|nr:hypothetical protein [Alicyclobacillus ferrooxydans]
MTDTEVAGLREMNIVLLVALEKLALHHDPTVSSVAIEALNKVKRLQSQKNIS